jgi:predicted RNA binding protein YcfA (HicA-like mRNA interferase family)
MPRLPRITGQQALRAVQRDGWQIVDHEGSHVQLEHPSKTGKVTVPLHAGKILKPKTLINIMQQAHLSRDEFRRLL